nr:two-component response regulator ARR2-like [Ipomoea batatas]
MSSVPVKQQVEEDNVADIPDSMVAPKSKLEWTPKLHSNFMKVVINLGGIQKATPKKILDAMDVPGLTRLNVSSHLQKVRGFMKSRGHKRWNRLARNHQHFIQCQLDYIDPSAAALSNTHHVSYKREGGAVSAQGGDQENDCFAGVNPILNHFSWYATNQETAAQMQFVSPTPPAALFNTNSSHHASYNNEGGADDFVPDSSHLLATAGDLSFIFEAGENEYSFNSTAGEEMPPFSAYATNQESDVLTQFVPPTPLRSPNQALPISTFHVFFFFLFPFGVHLKIEKMSHFQVFSFIVFDCILKNCLVYLVHFLKNENNYF